MNINAPVLIVGAGPTGLSASIALARQGMRSLLVERHPGTSVHPKATGISVRTMELFRAWGVDEAVRRVGIEVRPEASVSYTLASAEIARQPLLASDAEFALSPVEAAVCAQDALEPILLDQARKFREVDIRFDTELVSFDQDAAGVSAAIVDRTTGLRSQVRTRYLVAADGASSPIRTMLGIRMVGVEHVNRYISVLFRADLDALVERRNAGLYRIEHPEIGGVILPTGGNHRWILGMPWQDAGDPLRSPGEAVLIDLVRTAIGRKDVRIEFLGAQVFEFGAQVADRFRRGRVFLAGDAAHLMTPSGALGMNSAIHDAHNLAWKLSAVAHGWAEDTLLDTYEAERRPVAERNVARSIGLRRDLSLASFDLGAAYVSDAVAGDGPALTTVMPDVSAPAWPGCRAPHVWLESDGRLMSTIDLWNERFVLLTGDGTGGEVWAACAWSAARDLAVPFAAFTIGPTGDLQDRSGAWHVAYGIERDGAVLIRPDGHIGWRARRSVSNPIGDIADALSRMLGREEPDVVAWPPPWVPTLGMTGTSGESPARSRRGD